MMAAKKRASIRAAIDAATAARLPLALLTRRISDEDLDQAYATMHPILKAEGIFGAPRWVRYPELDRGVEAVAWEMTD